MRKTLLWFEPQATPEYYDARVTRIGRPISIRQKAKSNIDRAKRFPQYDLEAKRLGRNVGPGAYCQTHFSITSNVKKNSRTSFYFYRHRDALNNSHYFRDYSSTVPNFLRTS
jgi:hypothetical protein